MAKNELSIYLRAMLDEQKSTADINQTIDRISSKLRGFKTSVTIQDGDLQKLQQRLQELQKTARIQVRTDADTGQITQVNKALERGLKLKKDTVITQSQLNQVNKLYRMTLDKSIVSLAKSKNGQQALKRQVDTYVDSKYRSIQVTRDYNRATGELLDTQSKITNNLGQYERKQEQVSKQEANRLARLGQVVQSTQTFSAATDEGKQKIAQWVEEVHGAEAQLHSFRDITTESGKSVNQFKVTTQDANGMQKELTYNVDETTKALHAKGENLTPVINRMLKFVDQMKIAIVRTFQWAAAMGVFYGSLRKIREGIQFLTELDKDLTQVSVITGMTRDETRDLAKQYAELGNEMGKTVTEISHVTTELYRQGLAMEEVDTRLRTIIQLSSAANMEIGQSLEFVTSAVNALKVGADEAADVALRASQISASSVPELAEAFTKTASSAQATGVELTELGAIIAGLVEITQESPSSLGNSMKTLLARFNQVNEATGELNEDINRVGVAFRSAGVAFTDSEGQVRPFYDLITDLSETWDDLDKNTQLYISTMAAGVRQQNRFLAIMNNFNRVQEINNELMDASGSLLRSYDVYLNSVEASANRAQAAFEEMFINAMNSDAIKYFYDFSATVARTIDKIGGLNFVIGTLVSILTIANRKLAMKIGKMEVLATITGVVKGKVSALSKIYVAHAAVVGKAQAGTVGFTGAIQALNVALKASALTMKSVALAIWPLILPFIKIGIIIAGVTFLIKQLIKIGGSARAAREEFEEFGAALRDTGQQAKSLRNTVQKMEELEEKAKDNAEAQEELLSLQREAALVFPELIDGYDEEGNALVRNTELLREYSDAKHESLKEDISRRLEGLEQEEERLRSLSEEHRKRIESLQQRMRAAEDEDMVAYVNEATGRETWMEASRAVELYANEIKEVAGELEDVEHGLRSISQERQGMKDLADRQYVDDMIEFIALGEDIDGLIYAELATYMKDFGYEIDEVNEKIIEQQELLNEYGGVVPIFTNLQEAQQDIADQFIELSEKTQDARAALHEYHENGEFAMQTILKLAREGLPELIGALDDENEMYRIIQDSIKDKDEALKTHLNNMVESTRATIKALLQQYQIDLAGFTSVQEAKSSMLQLSTHPATGTITDIEKDKLREHINIWEAQERAVAGLEDALARLDRVGAPGITGSSGSGSSGRAAFAAEFDMYLKLQVAQRNLNHEMEKRNILAQDMIEGEEDHINLLEEKISLLKMEQQIFHQTAQQARSERDHLERYLSARGFVFSGEGDKRMMENLHHIAGQSQDVLNAYDRYIELQTQTIPQLGREWMQHQNEMISLAKERHEAEINLVRETFEEKRNYIDEEMEYLRKSQEDMMKEIEKLTPTLDFSDFEHQIKRINQQIAAIGGGSRASSVLARTNSLIQADLKNIEQLNQQIKDLADAQLSTYKDITREISKHDSEFSDVRNTIEQISQVIQEKLNLQRRLIQQEQDLQKEIAQRERQHFRIEQSMQRQIDHYRQWNDSIASAAFNMEQLKDQIAGIGIEHGISMDFSSLDSSNIDANLQEIYNRIVSYSQQTEGSLSSQLRLKQELLDLSVEIEDAIRDTNLTYQKQKKLIEDGIKAIEKAEEARFSNVNRRLDAELEKYNKIIDARLKLLDQEADEEDFQQRLIDQEQDLATIRGDIATLALDDSHGARSEYLKKIAELEEEERKLADMQNKRTRDLRKENLNNQKDYIAEYIDMLKMRNQDLNLVNLEQVEIMNQDLVHLEEVYNKEISILQLYAEQVNYIYTDLNEAINNNLQQKEEQLRREQELNRLEIEALQLRLRAIQQLNQGVAETIQMGYDYQEMLWEKEKERLENEEAEAVNAIEKRMNAMIEAIRDGTIEIAKAVQKFNDQIALLGTAMSQLRGMSSGSTTSKATTSSSGSPSNFYPGTTPPTSSPTSTTTSTTTNATDIPKIAGGSLANGYYDKDGNWHWFPGYTIGGYETGGYTGTFKGGKAAILHEKELVLNQSDTANLLDTIKILRDDFRSSTPQLAVAGGNTSNSNVYNLDIYIDKITGDAKGGDAVINRITKSIEKIGGKT